MAINPNISLAVRGIDLPDPLAQYGKVMAIQGAQQQNQLAQMQMREAQATAEERNALRQLDPTSADYVNQLSRVNPKLALEFRKEQTAADTARLTREKTQFEVQNLKRNFIAQAQRDTSQNPSDANITAYKEDLAANPLFTNEEKERLFAGVDRILATPVEQRKAFMASQGASASELKPSNIQVNQGGQTQVLRVPAYGGAPAAIGTYADVPKPAAVQAQEEKLRRAGAQTVNLPEQEKAFETELGKGQAKKLLDDKAVAEDARGIIDTVQQGRQLLQSGMITGLGAEALTQIGAALNQVGINFAEEPVANTQAFSANMAQNVGRVIKQFGAGTGLSNADREYAEKMAGGKITLDRKAIERILDINERAARNVIAAHNKRASAVKTNVPLSVEEPPTMAAPAAAEPQGGRPSLDQIFKPKGK